MSDDLQALPAETIISVYRVTRVLSINRFGYVYEGCARATGLKVVIREFFPTTIASRGADDRVVWHDDGAERLPLALKRLERLSGKLRQFDHPNFVRVVDFTRANDTGYVVSAHCDGDSLETWLRSRGGAPNPAELRTMLDPILDAVSCMHRRGGVHQDISAETIVIRPDGRPMLAGQPTLAEVAAMAQRRMVDHSNDNAVSYLAPEQVAGKISLDLRTDVYAVGAVLYRAVTGLPPIGAAPRLEGVRFNDFDPYVPLGQAARGFETTAALAVDQALALRAKDRLDSIDALRAALGWVEGTAVIKSAPGPSADADAVTADATIIRGPGRRTAPRALSIAELAAFRNQAAAVPALVPSSDRVIIAARKPTRSRGQRMKPWLAGIAVAASAGVIAFQNQITHVVQARWPGRELGAPEDNAWVGHLLVALGVVAAGAAVAWSSRSSIAAFIAAAVQRLRPARERGGGANGSAAQVQTVDVSVFAPVAAPAGGRALIQVYLHALDADVIAMARAREADADAKRRGISTLTASLAIGQSIQIALEAPGLRLDEPVQSIVWRGDPQACQFLVRIPKQPPGKVFYLCVRAFLDSVPIGTLRFTLSATERKAADAPAQLRGDAARRYRHAFLSYAAPDRAEVLKRVQALSAAHIDYFQDLLKLQPGELWEQRLYEEIDRSDLFLLFWSSHAAKSDWVIREAEYALERYKGRAEPDISPIILEGPPVPKPPNSLKEIHFNDSVRYVISAAERERGPAA